MSNDDYFAKVATAYKLREEGVDAKARKDARVADLIKKQGPQVFERLRNRVVQLVSTFNASVGSGAATFSVAAAEYTLALKGSAPRSVTARVSETRIQWRAASAYGDQRDASFLLTAGTEDSDLEFREENADYWLDASGVADELFTSLTNGILPPP